MRRRSMLAPTCVIVLLLVSGCNSTDLVKKRAEFMEPTSVDRTVSSGRAANANVLDAWPEDQWWRRFHNSDLDKIMETALERNPGLKTSSARLAQAEALTRVEGARLIPFLDAGLGMTQVRVPDHGLVAAYNPELAGVEATMASITPFSFRYEIDFWGKNRATLNAALGEAAAAEAEHAEVRLLLTTAVARSFIRGVALAQQASLAHQMVLLQQELAHMNEGRFRSGIDSADSVKHTAIDLENAKKREALTQKSLVLEQDLLARLSGQGPDSTETYFERRNAVISSRVSIPAHLPLELLAHRPDLAAAMHRAEAAAEHIHVAKAQFLPSIDLTALGGVQALTSSSHIGKLASFLFRTSAFNYEAVPGLHLPVFEGGRLRGHLEVARSEYDEAVELYNETLLKAIQQVGDSFSNLRQTGKILADQTRVLKSQAGELSLIKTRFRGGLNDRRDEVANTYTVVEQQFILRGLEADNLSAMVDLIQALGGGYSNDTRVARPDLHPEDTLSGLETLTPAWILEELASPTTSPAPKEGRQMISD